MKKFSYGLKKLKIIEQIAIVFFIGIVVPMSISGFIINNINQQSVRQQLRESAILITGVVSGELDFIIEPNETLSDIIKNKSKKSTLNSQLFRSLSEDDRQIYVLDENNQLAASHNYNLESFDEIMEMLPIPTQMTPEEPTIFGDEKNKPIVYLKHIDPEYTIIVSTTDDMSKQAIYNNRVKIILSVLVAILSMMLLVGFYIYYLYINIRQLFKAIIAISKGNYQRQIRLLTTTFTPYEIVFLANEFNSMVSEIHKSYLELQKKNKELKELNEFRSNLIDTVSHELRTPLTSIQGYTSRLMRQDIVIDEETKHKSLRIIKEQSERLKRLIEDLLTIPDIEGMRLRTVNTNVWLGEVLEQSELLLRKRDGHEIIKSIDENFPQILADKGRLEQVFVNLFENAVKYSYPDTPIIVNAMLNEDKAIIEVKNKCDKIPPEKLSTLFDKFVRLDDNMTRTTRGTGLGLFIVKGLVEAMGGKIELSSNEEFGFVARITLDIA